MKTKILLTLAAIFMAVNSYASIVVGDPVYAGGTVSITGVNTPNNYKYTLQVNIAELSVTNPQLSLTLTPIDPEQPAQVTAEDMIDQNFWEMVVRRYSTQLIGMKVNAQDCLTELNINGVALVKNLFYSYEKLKTVKVTTENAYTIPEGCFAEADGLQYVKDMVTGVLTLEENSMPKGIAFEVETPAAAIWQAFKESSEEYFFGINAEGVTFYGAEVTFNDGGVLTYGIDVPTLAERTFGDVSSLEISNSALSLRLPQNQDPAAVAMYYKIYEAGNTEAEEKEVVMSGYHYIDMGRKYAANDKTDIDLYGLETGKDYVVEFYWSVTMADEDGTTYTFGKDNSRFRIYFTFLGNPPVITGATLYGIGEMPVILSVSEFEPLYLSEPVESLILKGFDIQVSNMISKASMEYSIQDGEPVAVEANELIEGVWMAGNLDINLAEGLEGGKQYKLSLAFNATNDYGVTWMDNAGQLYKIYFSTVPETGIMDVNADNNDIKNQKWYSLDGQQVDKNNLRHGIYIVNGKKVLY